MLKLRSLPQWTTRVKRAALSTLIVSAVFSTTRAEVVDVSTATIDRQGNTMASAARVRTVQAQVQNEQVPPAPGLAPIQPQPPQTATPQPLTSPQPPTTQPPTTQPQATQPQATQPPATPQVPEGLNTDPNANIQDLVPQQPEPAPQFQDLSGSGAALGATFGAFSAAPTIIGDFQGGGLAQFNAVVVVPTDVVANGFYLSGLPGEQFASLAFEAGGDIVPNDAFSTGSGRDVLPGIAGFDQFDIQEPIPPSNIPTSPGPGFVFDGGTATYDGAPTTIVDGGPWRLQYSYSQTLGQGTGGPTVPVPSPGVSVRRVKIAENFSPEVRNRCFINFSFFNDAFGGLGDISRYVPGFERVIVDDLISIEARLPFAGTYGSTQDLALPEIRSAEFGNPTLIAKGVLLRGERFLWSGGFGVAIPLADDTVIRRAGVDLIRIKNESVFIQPFMGLLLRHSEDTAFQGYMQLDVAANGDPVLANLSGGPLARLGEFNDSTLMHIDVALSHTLHRNQRAEHVRQVIANAELHYSGTLQESDVVSGTNFTYQNLKRNFTIVNATMGLHFVTANNFVISPAMSVPLRSGLDESFDYEAVVQVNYLR